MMRTLFFSPLLVLVAACAGTPPPAETAEARCSVKVEFASYCCGVDAETKAAMEAHVAQARGVVSSDSKAWGREGESTRCVVTRTRADADRLYAELATLVPPVARRGPVTVTAPDGRTTPTQREK